MKTPTNQPICDGLKWKTKGKNDFRSRYFCQISTITETLAKRLRSHFISGGLNYYVLTSKAICTSHWCLVMSFCLKVCIYSHTRGVKLGLGLGFMQTSQVLPHWLNQSFSFWTLSYTQRHCHVRIEKSPNCCYNIRSTQFPRISLYALTLRFVLIEITKVVKPVH